MVESKHKWKAWLYLSPAIILLLVFTVWPIFNTVRMAFLEGYSGLRAAGGEVFPFGVNNFVRVVQYQRFLDCLRNTVVLCVPTVLISSLLALLIAVFLANCIIYLVLSLTAKALLPLLPLLLMGLAMLLRTLLGTRRKGLFIVASEIIQGNFVDLDSSPGHALDVFYDHFVTGMLLVVFVALRAHVAGQVVHRARDRPRVALVGQTADHTLDVFAVMLIGDPPLGIGHPAGRCGQLLARGLRVGRVHIELKIRHDEKVIPEFVGEIGRVAQQRIQIAHHGDHGPRLAVALAAVLDRQQRVDHLLDMAPVLGQVQLASCVIVILFHIVFAVRHTSAIRPPEPPARPLR